MSFNIHADPDNNQQVNDENLNQQSRQNNKSHVLRPRAALGNLQIQNTKPVAVAKCDKENAACSGSTAQGHGLKVGSLPADLKIQLHSEVFDSIPVNDAVPSFLKNFTNLNPKELLHTVITVNPEYLSSIIKYLQSLQVTKMPDFNYMDKQVDITFTMRSILVDWLVEVSVEFNLNRETLFLAVGYVDRFLSKMAVQRDKLQLVGTAALFLAAKYEEIYPPGVGDFVFLTDDSYTNRQVFKMEQYILKSLDFRVSPPTTNSFLSVFALASSSSNDQVVANLWPRSSVESLAYYIAELSLIVGEKSMQYYPSQLAACSLYLARSKMNFGDGIWTVELENITGYSKEELASSTCLDFLNHLLLNASQLAQKAVLNKYSQPEYHEVSKRIYFN